MRGLAHYKGRKLLLKRFTKRFTKMLSISFRKVLQTLATQELTLGALVDTPDGNIWRYVRANAAITPIGSLCTRVADTSVTDITSTANNDRGQTVFVTESGWAQTVGDFDEAVGAVTGNVGEGQFFRVKSNTADTIEVYSDYAFATALDTTSDLTLARPYLVRETPITTLNTILTGVAQVAFAANDYGFILIRGFGVILNGATDPVANEQLTPGDDVVGSAITIANGETPDDISIAGRALVAQATDDVAVLSEINIW